MSGEGDSSVFRRRVSRSERRRSERLLDESESRDRQCETVAHAERCRENEKKEKKEKKECLTSKTRVLSTATDRRTVTTTNVVKAFCSLTRPHIFLVEYNLFRRASSRYTIHFTPSSNKSERRDRRELPES